MATEEAARMAAEKAARVEAARAAYCLRNIPDSTPCYPLGIKAEHGDGPKEHFLRPNTGYQSDNAIDLLVPCGTPVYAVAEGQIGDGFGSLNSTNPSLKGLRLNLETGTERYYYSHLSNFVIGLKPGSKVTKGQLLGWSGDAGVPSVCHLHFGIKCEDPENFLKRSTMRPELPGVLQTDDEQIEFLPLPLPVSLSIEYPPLPVSLSIGYPPLPAAKPTLREWLRERGDRIRDWLKRNGYFEGNGGAKRRKDSSEDKSSSEHNWEHTDDNPPRDQLIDINDGGIWPK